MQLSYWHESEDVPNEPGGGADGRKSLHRVRKAKEKGRQLDEDKGFCVSIVIPDEQLPRFMRKIARNMRDETLRTLRVRL